jgi:hypothetical protein
MRGRKWPKRLSLNGMVIIIKYIVEKQSVNWVQMAQCKMKGYNFVEILLNLRNILNSWVSTDSAIETMYKEIIYLVP